MTDILPISSTGPTLTKLFLARKNYLAKRGKEGETISSSVKYYARPTLHRNM